MAARPESDPRWVPGCMAIARPGALVTVTLGGCGGYNEGSGWMDGDDGKRRASPWEKTKGKGENDGGGERRRGRTTEGKGCTEIWKLGGEHESYIHDGFGHGIFLGMT
jgi:hypothetical protein